MRGAKLTKEHLSRQALVYVRQSTQSQVHENRESTNRQYDLKLFAEGLGFASVDVIDDDLGRSGSGNVERPGFNRLVGQVLSGTVGAIVCLEASRLARNGRDWQHLLDLCGLVGAVVIDPQGVYEPRHGNDRLLLGIKGSLAEYELNILQERMLVARDGKAKRGELRFNLAPGYVWDELGCIVVDPDERVSETISLIFRKFAELGSANKVVRWFQENDRKIPATETNGRIGWHDAGRRKVVRTLKHPIYAGAYVWGRTESRLRLEGDRPRKTQGHARRREAWPVLLRDNHEGYISWEQYESNRLILQENAHRMKGNRKAGRGGKALLTGLVRCGHCGRKMSVRYRSDAAHRYVCRGNSNSGTGACFTASAGRRIDEAVRAQLLLALTPHAVDAALHAAERAGQARADARTALAQELEKARFKARRAERQYEKSDPDNRLVVRQLESRWEAALQRCCETEKRLEAFDACDHRQHSVDRARLLELAADLPAAWDAPGTTDEARQRIVHLVLHEALITRTDAEFELTLHWQGGRHTTLRLPRRGNRQAVAVDSVPDSTSIVRKMAGRWSDRTIALTLNRQPSRDPSEPSWTEARVRELRQSLDLPAHEPGGDPAASKALTLSQTAERLEISRRAVRTLIADGILEATQAVPGAPWAIDEGQLAYDRVLSAVGQLRNGTKTRNSRDTDTPILPGIA